MPTALVIGAGWAGLSCAVELAEKGFKVTLLEQSGRLGGRASSFSEAKTGHIVDNGQHLFMGCYDHTFQFLRKIGSFQRLKFQENLSVSFVNREGQNFDLKCSSWPSPLHLLSGLIRLKSLSLKERIALFKVYRALKNGRNPDLKKQTVEQWLIHLGQSERSRKYFWDLITIATLNEQPSIAEADSLAVVLKEAFFSSKERSRIAVSTVGLSDLCGDPAENYLKAKDGQIERNKLVTKILSVGDRVRGVILRDGSTKTADVYVSALPFFVLKNVLDPAQMKTPFFYRMKNLQSSPIFSVSLWLDRPITDKEFVGLLDTETQWLFNKGCIFSESSGGHIALVISGAHKFLSKTNDEILKMCLEELHLCFPESRSAQLQHWLIQREKNATLSPRVGFSENRLSQKTPLKNLFLCGDWTETPFPATIESAVWSATQASHLIQ
ncbi:MAG: oleate hydratase [Elusimicrobia bacterium]|nr:oleate hydratase [Elusimicrobiota bacterium]